MRVLTQDDFAAEQDALRVSVRAAKVIEGLGPIGSEMAGVDFPKRLKKRFLSLLETISAAPEKSFPQMTHSPAELLAMYRMLNNFMVTPEKIIEPHVLATAERADHQELLLVPHDTSGISYGGQDTRKDLGLLNDGGHGYYLHASLAVSADGLRTPLGLLAFQTLVRDASEQSLKKPKNSRKKDPERESKRWWQGVKSVEDLFEGSGTELVHLMDREADDYELLARMIQSGQRFVVRLSRLDRLLALSEPQSKDQTSPKNIEQALGEAQTSFERVVPLSARRADRSGEKRQSHPQRESRNARLRGAALRLRIRRPNGLSVIDGEPMPQFLELNVVRVWEVDVPEGVKPVEWYLLTTEPIETPEQIEQVVDYYRARWVIEEFFKALKSGCAIEKRQLESKDALLNALAIFLPIAYRLLLMRSLSRAFPKLPATIVFSDLQLQILRKMRPKLKLPAKPSMEEAVLAVAALGGHLKHNGKPGWQVLGRGYEKLLSIEEYLLLDTEPDSGLNSASHNLVSLNVSATSSVLNTLFGTSAQ